VFEHPIPLWVAGAAGRRIRRNGRAAGHINPRGKSPASAIGCPWPHNAGRHVPRRKSRQMPPDHASVHAALRQAFARYAARWPREEETARLFLALLDDPREPFRRERLAGHFTASCWLVDGAGARVLLTHHRKLGRWLQLGGHADGDRDLARVALREAEEES